MVLDMAPRVKLDVSFGLGAGTRRHLAQKSEAPPYIRAVVIANSPTPSESGIDGPEPYSGRGQGSCGDRRHRLIHRTEVFGLAIIDSAVVADNEWQ